MRASELYLLRKTMDDLRMIAIQRSIEIMALILCNAILLSEDVGGKLLIHKFALSSISISWYSRGIWKSNSTFNSSAQVGGQQ